MLPGSRSGEVKKNWPTMLAVFDRLKTRHPDLVGVVGSLDQRTDKIIRGVLGKSVRPDGGREDLAVVTGQTEAVLKWCDGALVKSGTVTLQVAARRVPMVTMYNMSYLFVQLLGRWLIHARTFTLPNLVSEWAGLGRVVPELIPHFGEVPPVVREVDDILGDTAAARMQREGLARIADYFKDKHFAEDSAREILGVLEEKARRHEGT
jgi:lipid-A-disaccharide synthase